MEPNARRWLGAWLGGAAIGVGNGVLREATYGRFMGSGAAHQVSTGIAIAAFAGYFAALQRRWPLASPGEANRVGAAWLAATIAFELGFGRAVAKLSWEELLDDYNLARGRTWPLVLAIIAAGPRLAYERTGSRHRGD